MKKPSRGAQQVVSLLENLSLEKAAAVASDSPYLRLVASAGAGKTETMTRKVVKALIKGAEPEAVVAFTFTERAAKSLKERIYRRVEQFIGDEKAKTLSFMFVGTIHAYCLQLLQDHFGFGNYDVLDANQETAFVMHHGWDLGFGATGYSDTCKDFLKSSAVYYDELIPIDLLRKHSPEFAGLVWKYENLLDQHRLLTFSRLVRIAVERLAADDRPVQSCKYLIVDEYQDINKAQEALIKAIGKHAHTFIVGDPRQVIYQWRGSDPSCFRRFKELFSGTQTKDLLENYRSGRNVATFANTVARNFSELELRTEMRALREEPDGQPFEGQFDLTEHETPEAEGRWIAHQIEAFVSRGLCAHKDIGILVRSVRTSGPAIIGELKRLGIPYIVGGTVGLFQRDEAQALGRIFAWIADMFWWEDVWTKRSLSGDQLLTSALTVWRYPVSRKALVKLKQGIRDGDLSNVTEAYQVLLVELGILSFDPDDRADAAALANLGRFNTLLTDFESSVRRGGREVKWPGFLKSLAWFMNAHAIGAYEEQPSDDIRGVDAVQLLTVHQAKGLEWPVVFVPALVSGRFPSSQAGRTQTWFVNDQLFDRARYEGGTEDERRLFYVAVTRARDLLLLSYFKKINTRRNRSQFLDETRINPVDSASFAIKTAIYPQPTEEIVTFSAGEVIEYLRCPFFYRLRELWGYQPGLVRELGFGRSVHHVLRVLAERAKNGADPEKELPKVMSGQFHLPFADRGTRDRLKGEAEKAIGFYARKRKKDIFRIQEVESRLEFELMPRVTITGRVDVIMDEKGQVEVRDYKTADDARKEDEARLQVRLYSLGLREIGYPVRQASLAYIMEDKLEEVPIVSRTLEQSRHQALGAVEAILGGSYIATPGPHCKQCDYSRICKFKAN